MNTLPHSDLIDTAFGLADAATRSRVLQACAAQPELASQLATLARLHQLVHELPDLKASARLRQRCADVMQSLRDQPGGVHFDALIDLVLGNLESRQAQEVSAAIQRSPDLARAYAGLQRLLIELSNLHLQPGELRERIASHLGAIHARSPAAQSYPADYCGTDVAAIIDYWRDELPRDERMALESRLAAEPALARLARRTRRTMTCTRALTLAADTALAVNARLALASAEADDTPEPSSIYCALVDYRRQELPENDHHELARRLERDPVLRATRNAIDDACGWVHRLPALTASPALKSRIATRLTFEGRVEAVRAKGSRATLAREALRGELPREQLEHVIDTRPDELLASSESDRLRALLALEPSDDLQRRIASALRREAQTEISSQQRLSRSRVFASLSMDSLKRGMASGRRAAAQRISVREKGSSVRVQGRNMASAFVLHAIVLLAFALVSPMVVEAVGDASHSTLISSLPDSYLPVLESGRSASPLPASAIGSDSEAFSMPLPLPNVRDVVEEVASMDAMLHLPVGELRAPIHEIEATPRESEVTLRASNDSASSSPWFRLRRATKEQRISYLQDALGDQSALLLQGLLAYLAMAQRNDGSWAAGIGIDVPTTTRTGRSTFPEGARQAHRIENTALAILALVSEGYGLDDRVYGAEDYPAPVRRGVQYLLDQQRLHPQGGFVRTDSAGWRPDLHADALATWALAEVFGTTQWKDVKRPLQLALKRLMQTQISAGQHLVSDRDVGGWPAQEPVATGDNPTPAIPEADPVTTLWALLAMTSAREAGVPVSQLRSSLQRVEDFFERKRNDSVDTRPDAPGVQHVTADNRMSSASSAMLAGMALLGGFEFSEASVRWQALESERLRPSFAELYSPNPAEQGQRKTNLVAWYLASLAAHASQHGKRSSDAASAHAHYLGRLGNTLWGTGALPDVVVRAENFTLITAKGGEAEQRHGDVFASALAALCITNAYRKLE